MHGVQEPWGPPHAGGLGGVEAFRGWHSVKTGNGLGFVSPVGQSKVDLCSALLLVGLDTVCLGTPQAVRGESPPPGGAWRELRVQRVVLRKRRLR